MKFKITVLILSCTFLTNHLWGQKLFAEFGKGVGLTSLYFKGKNKEKIKNQSTQTGISTSYSFNFSGKVWKNLYVKTEIGISSIKNEIDIIYNDGWSTRNIKGDYSASCVFYVVKPELRFFKKCPVFVNAGFTDFRTISGKFSGSSTDPFNGLFRAITVNAGIAPKIKDFGIIVQALKNYSFFGTQEDIFSYPQLGFNQWDFRLGISYDIK